MPHGAPAKTLRRNVLELTTSRPPTCKIVGENRSRPRPEETSVREVDAYDNSLLPQKNPWLGIQKFPAPLRREFGCKPMDSLAEWRRKLANEPQIFKNSLQIPC